MCLLNPYETSSCKIFDDFRYYVNNNYSDTIPPDRLLKMIDTFMTLMPTITTYLDDEYPILSIVVNTFDPEKQEISFSIELNTYDDISRDIQSQNAKDDPHMLIVNNLINLIRLNPLIRGDHISLNEHKKDKREILINEEPHQIFSSKYNFVVPVQRETEKEIFDTVPQILYTYN